ncbi:MAG: cereblon family protein [Thermodesulfobacteriota bacterium]
MLVSRSPVFSLKQPFDKTPGGAPLGGESAAAADRTDSGVFLLCANCLHLITSRQAAISVNGAHQHTFANPHGLVFTIGCFQQAPGCGLAGDATMEFSWFAGYSWRVAVCAACLSHLGWHFSSDGSGFFGLIIDRLVESDSAAGRP